MDLRFVRPPMGRRRRRKRGMIGGQSCPWSADTPVRVPTRPRTRGFGKSQAGQDCGIPVFRKARKVGHPILARSVRKRGIPRESQSWEVSRPISSRGTPIATSTRRRWLRRSTFSLSGPSRNHAGRGVTAVAISGNAFSACFDFREHSDLT
jgi:hypothetical protein